MSMIPEKEALLDALRAAASESDRSELTKLCNAVAKATWPSPRMTLLEKMLAAGMPIHEDFREEIENLKNEAQRVREAEREARAKRSQTSPKQSESAKRRSLERADVKPEPVATTTTEEPAAGTARETQLSSNELRPMRPAQPLQNIDLSRTRRDGMR